MEDILDTDESRRVEEIKPLDECNVTELKTLLKEKNLAVAGTKAELLLRLRRAGVTGKTVMASREETDAEGGCEQSEIAINATGEVASVVNAKATSFTTASAAQKEAELHRREKELIARELALAKREIELLRQAQARNSIGAQWGAQGGHVAEFGYGGVSSFQEGARIERGAGVSGSTVGNQFTTANNHTRGAVNTQRINVNSIAELLNTFDGTPRDFEAWEGQARLLREAYCLDDSMAKILVGMRLKGRASEWFHSKPEHIRFSFDELLKGLRKMFQYHQSKVTLRKKFEERKWKQSESIHEYVHDKIILGNKIAVPDEDILEYIVEEIPDVHLRDHARMQSFGNIDTLLQAFEKISLSDRASSSSTKQGKRNFNQQTTEGHQKSTGSQHGSDQKKPSRRCFNCGEHSHVGAVSIKVGRRKMLLVCGTRP
ncbi:uncharacterized protein [Temnothorax longispinosus]|uniref:uncharacterized protein n=1 Tax=Temnothorax longispinosus TaxID=300112 RepID=UPI003A99FDB9